MPTSKRPLRTAALASLMVAPALLLGALCFAQGAKHEMKHETAAQKYKNIKVLKDVPADQIIPIMHNINDALGVQCTFCHIIKPDHSGFELDDKPAKEMARKMILMVDDMKKREKVLKKNVTCFMCHHGSAEPQMAAEKK